MEKLLSRRFLITVFAMAFQLLPLFQVSPDAERAIVAVTIISVVSLAGLNIEDWLYARKLFEGNKTVAAALDAVKPEAVVPSPLVQSNAWPLVGILLGILIMRTVL
jgi:hypothetical protein